MKKEISSKTYDQIFFLIVTATSPNEWKHLLTDTNTFTELASIIYDNEEYTNYVSNGQIPEKKLVAYDNIGDNFVSNVLYCSEYKANIYVYSGKCENHSSNEKTYIVFDLTSE